MTYNKEREGYDLADQFECLLVINAFKYVF